MRPDGIAVLSPIGNKADIFCILEYKRMSDITDLYLLRVKSTTENQHTSLRNTLSDVIHRQAWKVEQISFVTGSRSVNEQDLRRNLKFFRVPEASIQSIYSKLGMRVFDVYANILKCMYSVRFNGGTTRSGVSSEAQSIPNVVTPLIHTLDTSRPDKYKRDPSLGVSFNLCHFYYQEMTTSCMNHTNFFQVVIKTHSFTVYSFFGTIDLGFSVYIC
jgi:hypothetical protein